MPPADNPQPRMPLRAFWLAVLTAHGAAVAAWWWLTPGGFGLDDSRFWINRILPTGALTAAVVARVAATRGKAKWAGAILLAIPAAWIAAAVAARIVFPDTFAVRWLAPAAVGGGLVLAHRAAFRGMRLSLAPSIASVLLGAVAAAWVVAAQRGDDLATHPLNPPMPQPIAASDARASGSVRLGADLQVSSAEGSVLLTQGKMMLAVWPMLTFKDFSPDRCWTIFTPPETRTPGVPKVGGVRLVESSVTLDYAGRWPGMLRVQRGATEGSATIEAFTRLPEPVWSHLNTFCEMLVTGHRKLSLSFSPCPDRRIEVMAFGYPFGRPRRAAYLGADGIFRIVEAASAEKGPFTELAAGPMQRGQPLEIVMYDQDQPVYRCVLSDWSAQADTTLSPTAGWGLPNNAIEFSLSGDADTSSASLFITLSATSLGRGFNSVGHASGTYRNAIRIEPIPAAPGIPAE